ncbi:MAG: ribonuclease HI family protein [Candidatus Berkelbacteria bacterium]|nr:MAG: ribonuclease HI family protein [Candidatus Berkelbacteria bacterium]QQG51458.1 MAG: ribonuclease HI family protein [Candidatus Berkelbacteria bacterium]
MSKATVYTDGAARGNPGRAAIAFVINIDGDITEHAEVIGSTTNNQAEYRAMLAACQELAKHSLKNAEITFNSDSELMVKQLLGEYRVKDADLKPHFAAIRELIDNWERAGNDVELVAVRREFNKRADQLANIALDA